MLLNSSSEDSLLDKVNQLKDQCSKGLATWAKNPSPDFLPILQDCTVGSCTEPQKVFKMETKVASELDMKILYVDYCPPCPLISKPTKHDSLFDNGDFNLPII